VRSKDMLLGEFSMSVAGEHNGLNALACIATSIELGLPIDKITSSLSKFQGTKRRQEFIGKTQSGALVFDDYAHHPTEIKATLASFAKRYPRKKILCIFQPHTYSRTKSLFAEFGGAFSDADEVVLTNIYPSQREEKDETVSSVQLAREIGKHGKKVTYLPDFASVVEYLTQKDLNEAWIILTMGAGDVYKINEKLITSNS